MDASKAKKRTWNRSFFSQSKAEIEAYERGRNSQSNVQQEEAKGITKNNTVDIKNMKDANRANWVDIFQPRSLDDLALHPKKLLEVKQWLLDYMNASSSKNHSKAKICLITGPTGSGKTATVRLLADVNQFEIIEWINPLDQNVIGNLGDQLFGETYTASGLTTFKSFLHQASRFRTLGGCKNRLLLVEDFPNALLKEPSSFEEILTDYLGYGKCPIIFVVSDSKSRGLNISYNLFPDEVKQKLQITHISFNSIASTFMQKAMKRFSTLLRQLNSPDYKLPTQTIMDSIVLSAQGDIRNALINFHFAALKGAPEVSITEEKSLNTTTTKSKRSKKQTSLKSLGRDESCTMLHALGRVFNPKLTPERTLIHSPELIASDFSTEPKKFLDFIQANYLKHFSDVDYIVLAADCISLADVLLQEYRENTLSTTGLNVATRGLMIANCKPVNGWLPARGPKRFRPGEGLKPSKLLAPNISKNLQATDFQTYVRLIEQNLEKNKN